MAAPVLLLQFVSPSIVHWPVTGCASVSSRKRVCFVHAVNVPLCVSPPPAGVGGVSNKLSEAVSKNITGSDAIFQDKVFLHCYIQRVTSYYFRTAQHIVHRMRE